jgi:hypothetical protein
MKGEPDSRRGAAAAFDSSIEHEIGILFLHGIGEQTTGQTLHDFGEPLCRWVQRWLDGLSTVWRSSLTVGNVLSWLTRPHPEEAGERTPDLEVIEVRYGEQPLRRLRAHRVLEPLLTYLHSRRKSSLDDRDRDIEDLGRRAGYEYLAGRASLRPQTESDAAVTGAIPPHAIMDLELAKVNGTLERESWLMAESHWGASFSRPAFLPLAIWIVIITPWMVGAYFGGQVSRQYRPIDDHWRELAWRARLTAWWGVLWRVVVAPVSVPVSVLIQLVVIGMMLGWVIPFSFVRRRLQALQTAIVGFLGDAYAFAGSPMRSSEIVGRVLRDVAWLERRCRKLVIVAHSQGAAVSYMALQSRIPPTLRLWFTFGSGLGKLALLQRLRKAGQTGIWAAVALWALATATGFVFLGDVLAALSRGEAVGWLKGIGYTAGFLFWTSIYVAASQDPSADMWAWAQLLKRKRVKWVDCFSTKDPVPAGPIFNEGKRRNVPDSHESIEVTNRGSFWRDHTEYWSNRDEFVGTLVSRIVTWAESSLPLARLTPEDEPVLAGAGRRRALRVGYLHGAQAVAMLCGVALIAARWSSLEQLGARIDAAVAWSLSLGGLALRPEQPVLPFEYSTVGAGAILVLTWIAVRLLEWLWELWDEFETYLYFSRSDFLVTGSGLGWLRLIVLATPGFLFVGAVTHAALYVIMYSLSWSPSEFWIAYRSAGVTIWTLLTLPLVIGKR